MESSRFENPFSEQRRKRRLVKRIIKDIDKARGQSFRPFIPPLNMSPEIAKEIQPPTDNRFNEDYLDEPPAGPPTLI